MENIYTPSDMKEKTASLTLKLNAQSWEVKMHKTEETVKKMKNKN